MIIIDSGYWFGLAEVHQTLEVNTCEQLLDKARHLYEISKALDAGRVIQPAPDVLLYC